MEIATVSLGSYGEQAYALLSAINLSGLEIVDTIRAYFEEGWIYKAHLEAYDGVVIIFERKKDAQ